MARPRKNAAAALVATSSKNLRLNHRLALQRWAFGLLGDDFQTLSKRLNATAEGEAPDGLSWFGKELLLMRSGRPGLDDDTLRDHDRQLVALTRRYNEHRAEPVRWKYYQYLALLFTGLYLDKFFSDRAGLLASLNTVIAEQNRELGDTLPPLEPADLPRLAFLQATGSGKTLQMHANILQYLYWREKHDSDHPLDRILLLTPNEGLSRQHLVEFRETGGLFDAELFDPDAGTRLTGPGRVNIEIIDIHKIREESGDKTVAASAFEGNNLVLVDEAHRGAASGGEWMERRDALCRDGFTFEYSATLVQAVNTASGANRRKLEETYARAILFDYGYKRFYDDGHGKDYRILNLDTESEETRELYLTGCLLAYFQQLKLFRDNFPDADFKAYRVAQPLLVFVGSRVTESYSEKDGSDMAEGVAFLARFADPAGNARGHIARLFKTGGSGILVEGRDIFSDAFDALRAAYPTPESLDTLYADCLETVFHNRAPALMKAEHAKGQGEVLLTLGAARAPFGIIRVGDTAKLIKKLGDAGLPNLHCGDIDAFKPLFPTLTEKEFSSDKTLNILLGSKMFAEGWSCWRVSTMGFLNIAKNEGSQAIQLFGRGVRLRGWGDRLKRAAHATRIQKLNPQAHFGYLERLNIFGLKAGFMATFRDYLEKEGLRADPEKSRITLPTLVTPPKHELRVLEVPPGTVFARQAALPVISETPRAGVRVQENRYLKADSIPSSGAESTGGIVALNTAKLGPTHLGLIDWEALHRSLLEYKQQCNRHALIIPKTSLRPLLADGTWYTLFIPADDLKLNDYRRCATRWQDIAETLLKKYCDRFYRVAKGEWESDRMAFRTLRASDYTDKKYTLDVDLESPGGVELMEELEKLRSVIASGKLPELQAHCTATNTRKHSAPLWFAGHLFQPLIFVGKDFVVKYSALALQESERKFVEDLGDWLVSSVGKEALAGTEIYLLRNEGRLRGFGFFDEAGFDPDFLLWLVRDGVQSLWFIDPHGMKHESADSPKLRLCTEIRTKHEARLKESGMRLGAAILAPGDLASTPFARSGLPEAEVQKQGLYCMGGSSGYLPALMKAMIGRMAESPATLSA